MVVNKTLFQSLQSNQNSVTNTQTSSKSPINSNFQPMSSVKTMIQKPQRLFEDKVDNSYLPFVPKISKKPNALRPLPGICLFFFKFSNSFFLYLNKNSDFLKDVFEKIAKQNVSINEQLFNSNLEL